VPPSTPVELHITNLDQNIDAREMKKVLLTCFREHIMVGRESCSPASGSTSW
jgi:meiosis arrest female protein 1